LKSKGKQMKKSKRAALVLSALLYGQGLLGFAALAAVLMKEPAHAAGLDLAAAHAVAIDFGAR